MIYIFGQGRHVSIVYDETTISHEEKSRASLVLKNIPDPEIREGFRHIPYVDIEKKEFYYLYEPYSKDELDMNFLMENLSLAMEEIENLKKKLSD